jgi:hypothetical protein
MPVQEATRGLQSLTYDDLVSWSNLLSDNKVDSYISAINSAGYDVSEMQAVEDFASGYMDFYANADGTYTVTQFKGDYQNVVTNALDSNVSTMSRGNISQMLNRGKDAITGKLNITKFPIDGSFASQASYVLGSVGGAVAAVSSGIALGKIISPLIYQANPNFWESIGVTQGNFNPETWNTITNGDDSNFAGLFNLIMGLDPQTGNSQAYMDETAFAYMALALKEAGVFNSGGYTIESPTYQYRGTYTANDCMTFSQVVSYIYSISNIAGYYDSTVQAKYMNTLSTYGDYKCILAEHYYMNPNPIGAIGSYSISFYLVSNLTIPFNIALGSTGINCIKIQIGVQTSRDMPYFQINAVTNPSNYRVTVYFVGENISTTISYGTNVRDLSGFDCTFSESSPIEGVSNQEDATLPDTSTWNDIPSTLQSLKQQYPDMWNDALTWDNVQPDGTNPQLTYVPVPMPQATSNTDTQPVSGTQTQTQTVVDPTTTDQTLLDLITQLITKTQPDVDTSIPPNNPVDTGNGNSPVPVPPSGSASALWAVYHPTQGQINSFGGWLWSTNFVDQLIKVFQNPMDAIISLHKVFITPIDAGSSTIHAGYLDSNVLSAYVTQQYVSVDCGSINCSEYFGNVFDYIGTSISLYLPFIGIVPLNVDDVMRSTLHVVYTCDIFTGALLAQVEVTRDANTVVMYQYGGDGSVQYPISGARSGGFLTGIAATIGAAASVVTGGAALPALGAALGGGVMSAQKSVQHSGGFSGNSGAMGCKKPYLIIERPQTKVAQNMVVLNGYPTNYSCKISDCSGHVVVSSVHVHSINATDTELEMISDLLQAGIIC